MALMDIVFFAAVAVFLGYRLWRLLGTHEADRPLRQHRSTEDDTVVPLRPRPSSADSPLAPEKSSEKPDSLNDKEFLRGANLAFSQIVEAYATADLSVLHTLLEGPLLETFEDTIAKRQKAKKTLEIDINRILSTHILDKREEKGKIYITVRFISEQCLVTRNAKGKILEGDPDRYVEVTDIWTFARSLTSSNPNWKLEATQLPEN